MPYNIYLSDNLITPFMIVSDNTIDSTTTSLNFIGHNKVGYGQAQDQDFLWLLENFSNVSPPSHPVVGQLWYDSLTSDRILKVCTVNGATPVWTVVGTPFLSAPTGPGIGNLWFDVINDVLNIWTGTAWLAIGPAGGVAPASVYEQDYSTGTTLDASTIELWKSGVNGSRLIMPDNTTWMFTMQVTARRSDGGQEFAGWRISGVINRYAGNVVFASAPSVESLGALATPSTVLPWTVNVTADSANKSLDIFVTGQAGKIVNWTAVTELTKVS